MSSSDRPFGREKLVEHLVGEGAVVEHPVEEGVAVEHPVEGGVAVEHLVEGAVVVEHLEEEGGGAAARLPGLGVPVADLVDAVELGPVVSGPSGSCTSMSSLVSSCSPSCLASAASCDSSRVSS